MTLIISRFLQFSDNRLHLLIVSALSLFNLMPDTLYIVQANKSNLDSSYVALQIHKVRKRTYTRATVPWLHQSFIDTHPLCMFLQISPC